MNDDNRNNKYDKNAGNSRLDYFIFDETDPSIIIGYKNNSNTPSISINSIEYDLNGQAHNVSKIGFGFWDSLDKINTVTIYANIGVTGTIPQGLKVNIYKDTTIAVYEILDIEGTVNTDEGSTLNIDNYGNLNVSLKINDEGTLNIKGSVNAYNRGHIEVALGGKIIVEGNGKLQAFYEGFIENFGIIDVKSGASLNVATRHHTLCIYSTGVINIDKGGKLDVVNGAAEIMMVDGVLNINGTLNINNYASAKINDGATLNVFGTVNINFDGAYAVLNASGIVNVKGGVINVYNLGTLNIEGITNISNKGKIYIASIGNIKILDKGNLNIFSKGEIEVYGTLDVKNGANLLARTGDTLLQVFDSGTLTVDTGGMVEINKEASMCIDGTLIVNGSLAINKCKK